MQKVKNKEKRLLTSSSGTFTSWHIHSFHCISMYCVALKPEYKPINTDDHVYYNIIMRYISDNYIRVI